jgi:galacturan 1,4-alpha-galacturonidase
MKLYRSGLLFALSLLGNAALASPTPSASCTMAASGKDDAPAFLSAMQACSTVTVPKGVTLNISSKMDMVS